VYPNNTIYEGEFIDGRRHGYGKLMQTNVGNASHIAIGEWVQDKPSEEVQWKITRGSWHYFGYISIPKPKKSKSKKEELITIDHLQRHKHVRTSFLLFLYHKRVNYTISNLISNILVILSMISGMVSVFVRLEMVIAIMVVGKKICFIIMALIFIKMETCFKDGLVVD
jgi:hypothetical protein